MVVNDRRISRILAAQPICAIRCIFRCIRENAGLHRKISLIRAIRGFKNKFSN